MFLFCASSTSFMPGFVFYSRGKRLHDGIISIRGDVWADKTSLTQPLSIEVLVPSQTSEQAMYMSPRGIDFGIVPTA